MLAEIEELLDRWTAQVHNEHIELALDTSPEHLAVAGIALELLE